MTAVTTKADIVVRDGTAYVDIQDDDLRQAIREACSFKSIGAEYRARGKNQPTVLYSRNKVPVGLLDRVCRVIRTWGADLQVSWADTAQAPKPRIEMALTGVELRDYQEEAALAAMLNNYGAIRASTGSGKSLMAIAVIQAKGCHAVVIVPTIDLLYQFKRVLIDHLVVPGGAIEATLPGESVCYKEWKIGQLGDGVVDPQPVTVATIMTMAKVLNVAYEKYSYGEIDDKDDTAVNARELRGWVESIGTVIQDETHLVAARVANATITKIPALYKYGMSASPWRDDGADLMIEAAVGPIIFRVGPERLVEHGYLMAPTIRVIDTSSWWTSAAWGQVCTKCHKQWLKWTRTCECGSTKFQSQWNDAYREEIVENEIRNQKIAEIVQELDRPTMVLVKQVKHGKLLAELIPDSVFLSGSVRGEEREETFNRVRRGELRVVICTVLGDLGLDLPNLEALVLAGCGKSSTRHLQRIGRVVRPFPGKQRPIVVDLKDSHIHAWYKRHEELRRKVEQAEWGSLAVMEHE